MPASNRVSFGQGQRELTVRSERLRRAGINIQTNRGELQFLKLNNGCICSVPDEIFTEIAIEVRKRTSNPLLFFNGYTNGCTGYLPHREEWEKGGFETLYSYLTYYPYHGHVMPFRKDTAENLVKLAADAWRDMTGME